MPSYTIKSTQRRGDRLISHYLEEVLVREYCEVGGEALKDEDFQEIEPRMKKIMQRNEEACKANTRISKIETNVTEWE